MSFYDLTSRLDFDYITRNHTDYDLLKSKFNFSDIDIPDPLELGQDYIDGVNRYEKTANIMRLVTTKLMTSPLTNGVIFQGSPGIGKSYIIRPVIENYCNEHDLKFHEACKANATGMYAAGFKCRHGGIILFDDCDSAFKAESPANILKHLTDSYDERKVVYDGANPHAVAGTDITEAINEYKNDEVAVSRLYNEKPICPPYYTFTGKVVCITNEIVSDSGSPHAKALISRMNPVTIELANLDIVYKMIHILLTDFTKYNETIQGYALECARYVASHMELFNCDDVTLRLPKQLVNDMYNADGDIEKFEDMLRTLKFLNW